MARTEVHLEEDIIVYNGVSPNGDGKNDIFFIDGIERLTNNNVQIFNRWGIKVFETNDYDTSGNVFNGFSDGRATIERPDKLPSGTYFYIIAYDGANGERTQLTGYLYLTVVPQ